MADNLIDPRLPSLLDITEPTRQQKRRVTRKATPCWKCRGMLTADDLCFADGWHDCHRSCAETYNQNIFDGLAELQAQDAA